MVITLRHFALAAPIVLSACGGGGDDDGASLDPRHAAMVGLYTTELSDEYYLEIDDRGRLLSWNFLGDEVDQGPNCHARIGPVDLEPIGDDRYRVSVPGNEEGGVLKMYRDGDALVEVIPSIETEVDGEGAANTTREESEVRNPLAAGLSSTDFAVCTDEQIRRWLDTSDADTLDDPGRSRWPFDLDPTRFPTGT